LIKPAAIRGDRSGPDPQTPEREGSGRTESSGASLGFARARRADHRDQLRRRDIFGRG